MYWSTEATALLNQYLDEVRQACEARGTDPGPVVAQANLRLSAQVDSCGVAEVSADLVRGILAAAGPAASIVGASAPPPLPRERTFLNPTEQPASLPGGNRQVWQGTSNSSLGCIVAALVLGGAVCIAGILGAVLLPALSRAHDAAWRATCQNNLKQVGLELLIHANEHDGTFPPLVNEEGYMIFGGDFAKSLDLSLLQCPGEGTDYSERNDDGTVSLDSDYLYLGYAIHNQAELDAMLKAFHENGDDLEALMALGKIAGPEGDIVPLREDFAGAESVPVLVEWFMNHNDEGASVLYLDGHTEFVKYGTKFPVTDEFYAVVEEMAQ